MRGGHSKTKLLPAIAPSNPRQATVKPNPLPKGIPNCYAAGVRFTQYWISKENSWDETNTGEKVWLGMQKEKELLSIKNETIAYVSSNTFEKCTMEGTCLLNDGRLINVDRKESFKVIGEHNRAKNFFGYGSRKQNLVPFVSVASNDLPYGQTLYLPELNGKRLSNGFKHNGCVRVDDDSYSFGSCQLDFFVVSYIDYLQVDFESINSISFENCTVLNYATESMMKWVDADVKALPKVLNDSREDWEEWMMYDEEHPIPTGATAVKLSPSPTSHSKVTSSTSP
ncbi:hypothetical protein BGW37DRAFT_553464 [Umbelopsis sp. PMI_123]|nr:hypothetical protein BGW37DRAFT_553464 [Umbelopsis sp. PMI_123]